MGCSGSDCCGSTPQKASSVPFGNSTPQLDCCSPKSHRGFHSWRQLCPWNWAPLGTHTHEIVIWSDTSEPEKKGAGIKKHAHKVLHHLSNTAKNDCCKPKDNPRPVDTGAALISSASDTIEVIDGSNPTTPDEVDVEKAICGVEHISIRVQGMDCTGCEKKLFKSLASLPELSNIKTSLLLAQAEFDLASSHSVHGDNITNLIKKMTGFSCTKALHDGAELELIVDNAPNLAEATWPGSVTNLVVLSKNRILATYNPKAIGARELLSDAFFRSAKLAPPSAPPTIASGRAHLRKTCWMTLLSTLCTIPVVILEWAPLPPSHEVLYGAISLGLATFIQVVVAGPFYSRALSALIFSRMIDMDLLIVLSSTSAYVYSVVAYAYMVTGMPLIMDEFFETSTLLVTLIMVGRMATEFARQKAMESITIESLQNPTAILIDPNSRKETEIDIRLLQYDDLFRVLPDSSVVTDGIVVSGESEVDEAMITGEATLVPKTSGMPAVAGSMNHSGTLVVRVTRLPCENTIKTIGAMVDEVKSSKPNIQELADQVASYFAPAILGLAVVVFIAWVTVGKTVRQQTPGDASINAMTYAISVLIVSCPCAIGLAVPMVVVTASGVAARHGLIFKTAETIHLARKISHVIFDKTGTLTQGKLHVTLEEFPADNRDTVLPVISALVTSSKHPVSMGIAAHLSNSDVQASTVSDLISVPGNGIEASWNNTPVRAGNPHWLGVEDLPAVRKTLELGLTTFCVTINNELVAIFGLKDLLRPDAIETISQLKKRSIEISILSGDNEAAVGNVATQLGIPASNIRARCSPEQKQAYVKSLQEPNHHHHDHHHHDHQHTHCDGSHPHNSTGSHLHTPTGSHTHLPPGPCQDSDTGSHRHHSDDGSHPDSVIGSHPRPSVRKSIPNAVILFVGDGTNDAPSLALASIGLHINGSASPTVASSAADAVLLRPSLAKILTLIDLSRAFHRRVLFNFLWSAVYNLAAVLLAAGAIPRARIPPGYAGLGEAVSIIPVVVAAVGLRFWTG